MRRRIYVEGATRRAAALTKRTLTYRLASAYDCWGRRRSLRRGSRNGIWFLDARGLDEPPVDDVPVSDCTREQALAGLAASGRFTTIELATLHALVTDCLTIDDIAQRDGCSRQAVLARLVGNSKGQGGILKKARALLPSRPLNE